MGQKIEIIIGLLYISLDFNTQLRLFQVLSSKKWIRFMVEYYFYNYTY